MPGTYSQPVITRRKALGLIAVTAGGGSFLPAHAFAQEQSPFSGLELVERGAGVCSLTPETTEGPFYFDPALERRDIRDGHEGVNLTVRLQVVDAACKPVQGARVDIWHCDAQGLYSGYPGQGDGRDIDTSGEKFLRGVQHADAKGIVSFRTIYPGWYRGRTTHIHFKVFPGGNSAATGQIFFPDDASERIYAGSPAYRRRAGNRDTFNNQDRIARRAGASSRAAVRRGGNAYEALMVIAVQRA